MASGEWLSKNEVKKLLKMIKRYLKDNPGDKAANDAIDEEFSASRWTTKPSRRYTLNKTGPKWKHWISVIEHQYCSGTDPTKDDVPFRRCPMEIGRAISCTTRLKQHVNNSSTTHIYGLVNVLLRKEFGFPEVKQFVLFLIW